MLEMRVLFSSGSLIHYTLHIIYMPTFIGRGYIVDAFLDGIDSEVEKST